jgi:hypothetical protein
VVGVVSGEGQNRQQQEFSAKASPTVATVKIKRDVM